MAKKQDSSSTGEKQGEQVRLDPAMLRRARVIAAALGMSVNEWIYQRLNPIIEKELPTIWRELGLEKED